MSGLEDAGLKARIVDILRTDPALNMVNFTVGKFTVGTMHFQILTAYMNLNRCRCRVNAGDIPSGAAAVYDPSSNTIITRDARMRYFDEKVTLVHEATHAVIDLMGGIAKGRTVTSLETETCAFVAGAMYKLAAQQAMGNSGVITTVFGQDRVIVEQADKLVRSKGLGAGTRIPGGTATTNAGSPVNFSPRDIEALQTAIKNNPLYSNWASTSITNGM